MEYESLESHIDCQLADLPEAIRTAMTPTLKMFWDELLPDGRRWHAQQHDFENDPAMEPNRKYWCKLQDVIWGTELALTKWEKTNDGGIPSEAVIREDKLAALGDRLANLKRMYKLPPFLVEDWNALTDDVLTEIVVNHIETEDDKAGDDPTGAVDFDMLATRQQLIDAFGSFTGMTAAWFVNLRDTPALLAARKIAGTGGNHPTEPLFCPYEVMVWLVDTKRRKGRKVESDTAWRLLESHFPRVYARYSVGDTRTA